MRLQAPNHLRRALVLAFAAAAILAMPAAAQAGFVGVEEGRLTYTALPGEANRLTITSPSPGTVRLTEAGRFGSLPVLIAGCGSLRASVTCSGVTSVTIDTGNGDDVISARDGLPERISCGAGNDAAIVDANDVVTDCETVDRPQHQPAPTQPGATTPRGGDQPTPPVAPTAAGGSTSSGLGDPFVNLQPPTIPAQTATVTSSGVAAVRVVCPPDAGACKGRVELVMLGGGSSKRAARIVAATAAGRPTVAGTTIGSATFTAKPGTKPIIRVRLNRRGRQRILRNRHTRCRMLVTTRTASGQTVTSSHVIILQPQRHGAARPRKKSR